MRPVIRHLVRFSLCGFRAALGGSLTATSGQCDEDVANDSDESKGAWKEGVV